MTDIEFITINKNAQLPHNIVKKLDKPLHVAQVKQFADGEIYVGLDNPEVWRDKKVVILQSASKPINEHVLQISFLAHELKNAGVEFVFAVVPYFGYSRQEKSDIKGKSGPAQVIAHLYQGAGIDCMMMVDLHSSIVQSFFVIPTFNISIDDVIAQHIKDTFDLSQSTCLIAPDKGGEERVAAIAQKLNIGFTIFKKERYDINKTRITGQVGSCEAARAIIIDDIIDTGGTAIQASEELLKQGFSQVFGYFSHGVFSKNAVERIDHSPFTKIFVSNTIPQNKLSKKVEVFDISTQIVDAIKKHV